MNKEKRPSATCGAKTTAESLFHRYVSVIWVKNQCLLCHKASAFLLDCSNDLGVDPMPVTDLFDLINIVANQHHSDSHIPCFVGFVFAYIPSSMSFFIGLCGSGRSVKFALRPARLRIRAVFA